MKKSFLLLFVVLFSSSCHVEEYWPMYSLTPTEGETILINRNPDMFSFLYGIRNDPEQIVKSGNYVDNFDLQWDGTNLKSINCQQDCGIFDFGEESFYDYTNFSPENKQFELSKEGILNHLYLIKINYEGRSVYYKFKILEMNSDYFKNYSWIKFQWAFTYI